MTVQNLPLSKLIPSPRNVRKTGGQAVADLAASIAANGVLQNLVVTAQLDASGAETGRYQVDAGGRRLRALKALAKAKTIRKDHPVPCRVIDAEDGLEASTAENVLREAMHPADQFEAFRDMVEAGRSIEDVAARFGVSALTVQRRLKLANVSPRLMAAYREGGVTLEQMMAFTITEDHAAQEQAWFAHPNSWDRQPHQIRARLTVGEVPANAPRARFVGAEAYEAAGGKVRRDLFDEEHGGFFTDAALLDRLTEDRLQTLAEEAQAEGWAWAEARLTLDYSELHSFRRVYPAAVELPEDEQAQLDALAAEYDALAEACGEDPEGGDEARLREVSEAIDALQSKAEAYSPEDVARAGLIVTLDHSGALRIERGLIRPEAVSDEGEDGGEGFEPIALPKKPKGALSDRLVEDLTAHRTAAIRACLLSRPDVALVAVVHSLLLATHYGCNSSYGAPSALEIEAQPLMSHPRRYAEGLDETKAGQALAAAQGRMQMQLPERADLWGWLMERSQSDLLDLLAYAAAQTVNAVKHPNGGSDRIRAADDLADAVGLDMSDWWTATAASFFGRVSKPAILAAVSEACTTQAAENIATMKKADLAASAEEKVAGKGWLPPILRSRQPEAQDDVAASAEAEPESQDEGHADDQPASYPMAAE